jgi:hypothetical protein
MVTSMSYAFDGREHIPKLLQELVGPGWDDTIRAPHTGKLADTLASLHIPFVNDMVFIVNKSLEGHEKDYNLITKSPVNKFTW